MKLFAITPDSFTCDEVLQNLSSLQDKGVSFLYLRSPLLSDCLERLIVEVNNAGILPLIPFRISKNFKGLPFGIHLKASETELLTDKISSTQVLTTASCHDFAGAIRLLEGLVDYVFISPVFKPFSKQGDSREPFPYSKLKELIKTFGERIVVLSGLNRERINILKKDVQNDFSVAGISMFFGNEK
jgi:thiamine monophosphate synthase